MIISRDNEAIFSLLDRYSRLPPAFECDCTYVFEQESTFFMVLYLGAGIKREFILFSIEQYRLNFIELEEIQTSLEDLKLGEEHQQVLQDALAEINRIMESGGSEARYFDAH